MREFKGAKRSLPQITLSDRPYIPYHSINKALIHLHIASFTQNLLLQFMNICIYILYILFLFLISPFNKHLNLINNILNKHIKNASVSSKNRESPSLGLNLILDLDVSLCLEVERADSR